MHHSRHTAKLTSKRDFELDLCSKAWALEKHKANNGGLFASKAKPKNIIWIFVEKLCVDIFTFKTMIKMRKNGNIFVLPFDKLAKNPLIYKVSFLIFDVFVLQSGVLTSDLTLLTALNSAEILGQLNRCESMSSSTISKMICDKSLSTRDFTILPILRI